MHIRLGYSISAFVLAAAAVLAPTVTSVSVAEPSAQRRFAGAVYTSSNAPGGMPCWYSTAVVLSRSGQWLLAVNAGSDSVSVLRVRNRGLRLVDVTSSGGSQPVSVTEHRGLVYVLDAGCDAIAGFRPGRDGRLLALSGSTRSLSGSGTGPARAVETPAPRLAARVATEVEGGRARQREHVVEEWPAPIRRSKARP